MRLTVTRFTMLEMRDRSSVVVSQRRGGVR